jgi:D-mannonate dehydratase
MSPPSNTEKEEQTGTGARRSTRLAIAMPITLSGKDAAGNSFKENTRTIVVNKHGAKIATMHQLVLGTEVEIGNRALGLTARAAVVWAGDKRTPQKYFEAGIQLFKAQDIWGIEFPPGDWQEKPATGASNGKSESAGRPPTGAPAPAAAPPPVAGKSTAAPVPIPSRPGEPAAPKLTAVESAPLQAPSATVRTNAEVERMIERFTRQMESIASQKTKVFEGDLQNASRQIGAETEARLHQASARAEEDAATAARGLAVGVQALEERLQSLRADVEQQSAALAEARRLAGEESETAQRKIREGAWQALETATQELNERIQKDLETVSADFLTGIQSHAQQEQHRILQEQKAALAGEFEKQTDKARKLLTEELKASWQVLAEDAHQQLMAMATTTIESMNSAATEGIKQFRTGLEESAQNAQGPAGEKLQELMGKLADERSSGLVSRLESVGSETQERLLTEVRAKAGEAYSAQLEALASEGLEKIRKEFESLLERTRTQLEEATAVFQNQVMQEAQVKLAYVTERLTEDSATQLATITKENLEMAEAKLQEVKENVVTEAEDAFRARLAEVIAPALKPNDRRSKPRFGPEAPPEKS